VHDLLVSLLVPALAIAVNPVPIVAVITLLVADHGRRNAAAFLASLVAVMAADGLVTIYFLGDASSSSQNTSTAVHGAVQLALGLAFLALFVVQWRSRPRFAGETPAWMKMLDKAGFGAALGMGVALTNYALLSSGMATIVAAGLPTADEVAALAFFVALSVSTVVVPLVLCVVFPRWASGWLARFKVWLIPRSRTILLVVFGAIGALSVVQGAITLLT
jgi:hypothetical protein